MVKGKSGTPSQLPSSREPLSIVILGPIFIVRGQAGTNVNMLFISYCIKAPIL